MGEILITSIDQDGTLKGYDLDLIKNVSEISNVPLVVCGGAGELHHFDDVLKISKDINLALGTALHKDILKIKDIKIFLKNQGCTVRQI